MALRSVRRVRTVKGGNTPVVLRCYLLSCSGSLPASPSTYLVLCVSFPHPHWISVIYPILVHSSSKFPLPSPPCSFLLPTLFYHSSASLCWYHVPSHLLVCILSSPSFVTTHIPSPFAIASTLFSSSHIVAIGIFIFSVLIIPHILSGSTSPSSAYRATSMRAYAPAQNQ